MGVVSYSSEKAIQRAEAAVAAKRARGPLTGAFWLKGIVLSLVVAGAIVALAGRFSIGIATQESLCLPPYRIWVIDKYDTTPIRGEIFAFKSAGLEPVFEDGTLVVKVLEGMPGDHIEVTLDQSSVNGAVVATGLQVAHDQGVDPARYVRTGTIAADRYWFFGKTADSFDSRYWGSVAGSQIIGKAYPIW